MSNDKRLALVGAGHDESLRSLRSASQDGSVSIVLFGDPQSIEASLERVGWKGDSFTIVPCVDDAESCRRAVCAASAGEVQVLMKGSVHTADFIKAILDKQAALVPEGAVLSHVARVALPWMAKPMLLTDAAINIAPDLERKVTILKNALYVARKAGIACPKVALVCPVETVNPKIVSTTDAAQIVFLQNNTALLECARIEGPFGLDVALSRQAALTKGIQGEVPGSPDILLLPNLDSANATLKAFSAIPGVSYAGIVAGGRIPIVLTSRSDSAETRVESIKMALSISG
jgi:phosphate butyryltransferase